MVVPYLNDSIVQLQPNGIPVKAIPYEHSPYWDTDTVTGIDFNRHAKVEHLQFVFELDGRVLYHSGDALMEDIARYQSSGFGDSTIDLAMVTWDVIRPKRVILMHMFPNRPQRREPEKQTMVAPEVILPKSLMQQWTLD